MESNNRQSPIPNDPEQKITNQLRTNYTLKRNRVTDPPKSQPQPLPQQIHPSDQDILNPFSDPIKQEDQKKILPETNWMNFMSRTSNEESISGNQKKILNSKNYISNIFTPYNLYNDEQIRHIKPTIHSNYSNTSQITSLPGCVKRDMYEIKDDKKFYNNNSIGHLMKVQKDYLGSYEDNTEYKNEFPSYQRYGGSYKNKNESQIFKEDDGSEENRFRCGKKTFRDNKNFQSNINFC